MNKDLTEEFLISLGFKKDGYTNLSYDFCLSTKNFDIFINLEDTPDKPACIVIFNNNKDNQRMVNLEYGKFSSKKKFTEEDLRTAIKLSEIIYALE